MRVQLSLMAALGLALAVFAAAQAVGADKPKSREDWVERVTVIGQRGNVRDWLTNHTFRGTEGFADGSAPSDVESRTEYTWQVYYAAGGKLEAHFTKLGARVPHGPIEELNYVEYGTWRIDEEGDLCQTIPRVGWGVEVCFYIIRRGTAMAFYYTRCGAFNRCYTGRLGPAGEVFPGRVFTQ
ncbi:MAG: hypothetical protein ABL996_02120 [Micropepsaceae bacterium]